jgi:hypothetical protein
LDTVPAGVRHERLLWVSRDPVPEREVPALKPLLVGLCVLFVTTQAVAATSGQHAGARAGGKTGKAAALTLDQKLALKVKAARKRSASIRFFQTHRSLFRSADTRAVALGRLVRAKRGLARAQREIRYYERLIHVRDAKRQARRLATAAPRVAICEVFGQYCRQALAVAWCESGHETTARNGQYLGLFQMGTYARQLAGHGDTAYEQALAAHKLFVLSGRDWSPWSCRWAAY